MSRYLEDTYVGRDPFSPGFKPLILGSLCAACGRAVCVGQVCAHCMSEEDGSLVVMKS